LEGAGFAVLEAESGAEAKENLSQGVDLVLLDFLLPDVPGFEILEVLHHLDPDVPIIVMTMHSGVEQAVKAMKAGAYHYMTKPLELDELVLLLRRGVETARLRRKVRALAAPDVTSLVGESEAMRRVKLLLPRVASSPATTVLITGESGTGKDLAARAIHTLSDRAEEPFVNITCSALPAELLESELFGHERGAFTDAKLRKQGLFEQAHRGTIFLDEIGEMALPLQAKLLRFLEEKRFRRVGGTTEIDADVRIIAATNVDLRRAVRDGAFREDLYYRLAVLAVHLPPLRERVGDIGLLALHFLARFREQIGRDIQELSPEALRLLRSHPWPGNVRELRNAVERAVLLADGPGLEERDFEFIGETCVDDTKYHLPDGGVSFRELERSLVEQALERTGGNQTRAARLLGMNRDQIRYRMQRYGMLPLPGHH
jgi:DNA-binding NtrC family response regulator